MKVDSELLRQKMPAVILDSYKQWTAAVADTAAQPCFTFFWYKTSLSLWKKAKQIRTPIIDSNLYLI